MIGGYETGLKKNFAPSMRLAKSGNHSRVGGMDAKKTPVE
jgi:hypothetical protein